MKATESPATFWCGLLPSCHRRGSAPTKCHPHGVFDAGLSGAKGRDQRPRLDSMMKMVARHDRGMVGRSHWPIADLLDLLRSSGCLAGKFMG
jgi:hypothetical protein